MFSPITDIGKIFITECQKLNDYFLDPNKVSLTPAEQEQISQAVKVFFNSIRSLPGQVEQVDHSLSVLFEIDQAICGSYGAKVFSEGNVSPMRKLLRDIIALWYRYELLAYLERKKSAFLDVVGIRSYYEEWMKSENVGIEESEYDRILSDVAMLLENTDNLEVQTRILLFSMLGDILVTLGVSRDDAEKSLSNYKDEIKGRVNLSLIAFAEILLNLHVLHATKTDFETIGAIDFNVLHKAIRYWSSTDEFSDTLFKSWNIYWENDYFSQVTREEEKQLSKDKHSLFSLLKNPSAKMGIGHSFIEFMKHKEENPGLTSIFKPAPIFMFGNSGVGKSSFLTSFCFNAQMRVSKSGFGSMPVTLSRELQAHYQNTVDAWQSGSMAPTSGYSDYTFWEDLNINSYLITDYGGKDTQPDQWEPQLQELFRNARALLFFIDDNDYMNEVALRRQASLFDSFLQYWMQSNPQVRHIPIGLVLTKCDLILGDALRAIPRPTVVPDGFQPAAVEGLFDNRLSGKLTKDMNMPFGRYHDCVLNDKINNSNPVLQDLIHLLLDNFAQFFSRVLDVTYNYQVFLTSSAPSTGPQNDYLPYGVREPIAWIASIFEKVHIDDTLETFNTEEEQIKNEINLMTEDVTKMYQLRDQIDHLENEIKYLHESSNVFTIITRDLKIKGLNNSKKNAEKDLLNILQRYVEKPDTQNKTKLIQSIEVQISDKKDIIQALDDKRRLFLNRKKVVEQE